MSFKKGYKPKHTKYVDGYEDEFITIKKRIDDTKRPKGEIVRNYICVCKKCGKEFIVSHTMIRDKIASYCKDCKKEIKEKNKNKYYGTRIYSIWYSIKCRCYYKKHPCYSNYGGRGIEMCDEWKNSSTNFGDWAIENGYSDNLTIDRIDNNKGYSPDNCRWSTRKQQCENRRCKTSEDIDYRKRVMETMKPKGKMIEINGETKNITDWCKYYNISKNTVETRMYRLNWDVVKAITTPSRKRGS